MNRHEPSRIIMSHHESSWPVLNRHVCVQVKHMGAVDELARCPHCDQKPRGFEQALAALFGQGPWGPELAVDLCGFCGGPHAIGPATGG